MRTGEAEQSHGGRTGSGQAWEVSHPCELAPGRGKKGDLWPWAWHPQRSQSAQDHGLFGQRQKVACGWSRECLVRNWQGMKMKRLSSGQIWLLLPGKKGAELCPVNDRRVLSTTHKVAQPWRLGAHTHTNTHPTQTHTRSRHRQQRRRLLKSGRTSLGTFLRRRRRRRRQPEHPSSAGEGAPPRVSVPFAVPFPLLLFFERISSSLIGLI